MIESPTRLSKFDSSRQEKREEEPGGGRKREEGGQHHFQNESWLLYKLFNSRIGVIQSKLREGRRERGREGKMAHLVAISLGRPQRLQAVRNDSHSHFSRTCGGVARCFRHVRRINIDRNGTQSTRSNGKIDTNRCETSESLLNFNHLLTSFLLLLLLRFLFRFHFGLVCNPPGGAGWPRKRKHAR